jgi:phosphoribosylaminoimidazole-succinocarboxamide synthase
MVEKREQVYEGKAKILFATDEPDKLIAHFKDDATAFNAKKRGTIINKGAFNNKISAVILKMLEEKGIPTHFIELLSERESLVAKVEIIPVEVVVRNVAAGSLAKKLGLEEGLVLQRPIVEFFYKSDELDDPPINADIAIAMGWATEEECETLKQKALEVNVTLVEFFDRLGIRLIDYKLEFGRSEKGILLADEITPDGCRLWDKETGEKLDKDRFRRDLGQVEEAYQRVYELVTNA